MGGERQRASAPIAPHPDPPRRTTIAPARLHPSLPRPHPSFLRPPSVIPASSRHSCAGRNPPTSTHQGPLPQENSSLPPGRGEVRWGVKGSEPTHQSRHTPIVPAAPPPHPRLSPALPSLLHPSVAPAPLTVIPAQAGIQVISAVSVRLNIPPKPLPHSRRTLDADSDCAHRAGSCLRRNDGRTQK